MNAEKFVLNKLIGGRKDSEDKELTRAICFVIDKLGYFETMKLPLPAFFELLDYYEWVAEEEKKALKKK